MGADHFIGSSAAFVICVNRNTTIRADKAIKYCFMYDP